MKAGCWMLDAGCWMLETKSEKPFGCAQDRLRVKSDPGTLAPANRLEFIPNEVEGPLE